VGRVGETPLRMVPDLLSGGPVCKAFSPGARLFGTKGKRDSRNTFPAMFRVIEDVLPDYVLMENTFGLTQFSGYLAEMQARAVMLGYRVDGMEVDCYQYGVPQHRRRLIITMSRCREWDIREPVFRLNGPKTVREVMYEPPDNDPWPLVTRVTDKGMAYLDRDPIHLKKHKPMVLNEPASTVYANVHRGVPYGLVNIRNTLYHMGPRLAARLQGVPDEYDLSSMSKTAALEAMGNGFPGQVVAHLTRGL